MRTCALPPQAGPSGELKEAAALMGCGASTAAGGIAPGALLAEGGGAVVEAVGGQAGLTDAAGAAVQSAAGGEGAEWVDSKIAAAEQLRSSVLGGEGGADGAAEDEAAADEEAEGEGEGEDEEASLLDLAQSAMTSVTGLLAVSGIAGAVGGAIASKISVKDLTLPRRTKAEQALVGQGRAGHGRYSRCRARWPHEACARAPMRVLAHVRAQAKYSAVGQVLISLGATAMEALPFGAPVASALGACYTLGVKVRASGVLADKRVGAWKVHSTAQHTARAPQAVRAVDRVCAPGSFKVAAALCLRARGPAGGAQLPQLRQAHPAHEEVRLTARARGRDRPAQGSPGRAEGAAGPGGVHGQRRAADARVLRSVCWPLLRGACIGGRQLATGHQ